MIGTVNCRKKDDMGLKLQKAQASLALTQVDPRFGADGLVVKTEKSVK